MNIDTVFRRYGRPMCLTNTTESAEFRAFLQPLRYKNKMYLFGVNTRIGYNSQGHYLYIGPPQIDLTRIEAGVCLLADGTRYRVDRAEKVCMAAGPVYIWAVLRTVIGPEDEGGDGA